MKSKLNSKYMKYMKTQYISLLILALLGMVLSCGGGDTAGGDDPTLLTVNSIAASTDFRQINITFSDSVSGSGTVPVNSIKSNQFTLSATGQDDIVVTYGDNADPNFVVSAVNSNLLHVTLPSMLGAAIYTVTARDAITSANGLVHAAGSLGTVEGSNPNLSAVEIDIFSDDYVSLDFVITTDRNATDVVFGLFPSGSSPASADAVRNNANKRTRNLVAGSNENLLISQSSASTGDAVLTPGTTYELWYALSYGSSFGKLTNASTEALTGDIGVAESFPADGETRAFQYRTDERLLVSFVKGPNNFDTGVSREWWVDGIVRYSNGKSTVPDYLEEVISTNNGYTIVTLVKKSGYTYRGSVISLQYGFDRANSFNIAVD